MSRMREAVWTPVGLDLTEAKSVDEALKLAELDFDVVKKNLYDEYGNAIPNWYRNVRSDNNAVLGVVTDKYKIVQNREAFEFVDELVQSGMQFDRGGVFHNGKAAWLEAKLPDEYEILGDPTESRLIFKNSHDGLGAVKVAIIPHRIACSNALNFALKTATRIWSVVHSSKIDERIQDARASLGLAELYMSELSKEAERLATEKMSDEQFIKIIDTLYPLDEKASNRKITNVTEIKNGLLECAKESDLDNFRGTKWEKLMIVSDWADHRAPGRKTVGFDEARFEGIIGGDKNVDKFYQAILAA